MWAFILLLGIEPMSAQDLLSGDRSSNHPILFTGDTAVLETGEPRKDLDCTVTPGKAALGFDLKFHSGYSVSIPMWELEGSGNGLAVLFRVSPKSAANDPVYFLQKIRVARITETSGAANLDGVFDLGEGSYRVDWLMRDLSGRYCSSFWDVEAALAPKDKQMAVALPPQTVRPSEDERFQAEPPVHREPHAPLSVKVLMNFAPQKPAAATLDPQDKIALVSILRNLSRNPRIGKISLVAFNIQEQRVLYRQAFSEQIDFPAMGTALKSLNLGVIDLGRLGNRNGDTEFLSSLIRNETTADASSDGLVFVGPKSLVDSSVPQDDLKQIGELDYPVFYMNYIPDPQATPWRDAIGRTVKFFKGRVYTISGPRDLWNAVAEVVDRIAQSKQIRSAAVPTGGIH